MITFGQLNKGQQKDAIQTAKIQLVSHLYEGNVELTLSNERLQRDHMAQLRLARRKNDVDILFKLIKGYPLIQKEVDQISIAIAEGSMYNGDGSPII